MMKFKKSNGITMISLIATIIILGIIAATGIGYINYQHTSLIDKTRVAEEMHNLGVIEEQANLIFLSPAMKDYRDKNDSILFSKIVEELKNRGYNIKDFFEFEDEQITGINLSQNTIQVYPDENGYIDVKYNENKDLIYNYYAVVNKHYYKMNLDNAGVVIDREPIDIVEDLAATSLLTAEIKAESSGTGITLGQISGSRIPFTVSETANGVTTVLVKYGSFFKECDIEVNDLPEVPNGHLSCQNVSTVSTPANTESYALGETIRYEIVIANDGNLTITDITVNSELTGDEWTIASLAPGESKIFNPSYTVTEADILAGEVLLAVTASGTSPDPDEPNVPVEVGEYLELTEDKNSSVYIDIDTINSPENGESYSLDERINYKITVTNDGNLTLTDILVTSELTGSEWTISSLAPGASEEFTDPYRVDYDDVVDDEIVIEVTVEASTPDPDEPEIEENETLIVDCESASGSGY